MGITLVGKEKLNKKLDSLSKLELEKAMGKCVSIVQGNAKTLAPVDTGNLRGSISAEVIKEEGKVIGKVFTNCEYAQFVEFGTGVQGQGTFPYNVEGLNLSYTNHSWKYKDAEGNWHTSSGHKAQPFMFPSLMNNKKLISEILKSDINLQIKGK